MSSEIADGRCRVSALLEVGDQHPFALRAGAFHDGALTYAFMSAQHRFDLAELDTVTAQLDLMVNATKTFDRAVRSQPGKIARAVQVR
jgi:hypothetical protein